jgi:hypothetical protein
MKKQELQQLLIDLADVHGDLVERSESLRLWRLSPSYGYDVERIAGALSQARRFTKGVIERAENEIGTIETKKQREAELKRTNQ